MTFKLIPLLSTYTMQTAMGAAYFKIYLLYTDTQLEMLSIAVFSYHTKRLACGPCNHNGFPHLKVEDVRPQK